jgi:hypothetical protein
MAEIAEMEAAEALAEAEAAAEVARKEAMSLTDILEELEMADNAVDNNADGQYAGLAHAFEVNGCTRQVVQGSALGEDGALAWNAIREKVGMRGFDSQTLRKHFLGDVAAAEQEAEEEEARRLEEEEELRLAEEEAEAERIANMLSPMTELLVQLNMRWNPVQHTTYAIHCTAYTPYSCTIQHKPYATQHTLYTIFMHYTLYHRWTTRI